ncbi:MAG: twin-arginine translocase TatA/TatE family subunit [Dehalococcoidales bacterium]|nr:twin-arginine translocase TatA/TatE family subunit [Dehalococcoidales bacterium]
MDFFSVGTGEILLILVIGLIVFGPTRIVEIMRGLGKLMYNLRKMTSDLTTGLTREIEEEEKKSDQLSGRERSSKSEDTG